MSKDKYPGQDEFMKKFEKVMDKREAIKSKYSGLTPVNPLPDIPDDILEAMEDFKKRPWKPITGKMAMFKREEKGVYTDEGTPGLFYFKATHWRNFK